MLQNKSQQRYLGLKVGLEFITDALIQGDLLLN